MISSSFSKQTDFNYLASLKPSQQQNLHTAVLDKYLNSVNAYPVLRVCANFRDKYSKMFSEGLEGSGQCCHWH